MNPEHQDAEGRPVTRRELSLELKSFSSNVRLMIIASVALNQFLANVSIPTAVAAPALFTAIFAPALKAIAVSLWSR